MQQNRNAQPFHDFEARWRRDDANAPSGDVVLRSIHDEEVNAMRERVASTWVQRAQAGRLPAKEYAR